MNLLTCYLLVETGGCPHPTPMPTLAGRLTLRFAFSRSYCLQQQPVSFSTLWSCSRKYCCGRIVVLGMESKLWWCSLVSRRSLGVMCARGLLNTLAHRGRGLLHKYVSHDNLQKWLLPYSYVTGNNSKQTHPMWPVLESRGYGMGNCLREQKRTFLRSPSLSTQPRVWRGSAVLSWGCRQCWESNLNGEQSNGGNGKQKTWECLRKIMKQK